MRALKMRSVVVSHWKVTTTESRHWKWSSYNYTRSCPRTQCQHSTFVWHWKQTGKVKRLCGLPHKLTKNFLKIIILKSSSLILHNNNEPSLIRLWCAMKGGFYRTTGNDQLSSWSKKLQSTSQSQTCTKKESHSYCWVVCCPSDTLQLSESQHNPYIWDICSANQEEAPKTARPETSISQTGISVNRKAQFFSMTTPNYMLHSQHFKSWRNWAIKFCLIHPVYPSSGQPTTTSSSTSTTFCRKNASTTSRRKKMLSKSLLTHEAWIFMLQE